MDCAMISPREFHAVLKAMFSAPALFLKSESSGRLLSSMNKRSVNFSVNKLIG